MTCASGTRLDEPVTKKALSRSGVASAKVQNQSDASPPRCKDQPTGLSLASATGSKRALAPAAGPIERRYTELVGDEIDNIAER